MVRVLRDLTIASAILAAPISALYTKNGPVLLLDEDNFEKELLHEKHASVRLSCEMPTPPLSRTVL